MPITQILPWIAGLALVAAMVMMARDSLPAWAQGWIAPALLSGLFLGWSLIAVIVEGPLGFWPEHVRNLWGNQIWFDLLLAVGCAWAMILPRARQAGMAPLPWLVLILCSGSIGLLAMVARLRFLEARRGG